MTEKKDPFVWWDGEFVPLKDANVNVLTHSFHYGIGAYEGVRCYQTPRGPTIFRLQAHTNRLRRSAHVLNMGLPYADACLNEAQQALIRRNELGDAYIRPLVYYDGDGYIGLHTKNLRTRVFLVAFPWKNYLSDEQYQQGIRIKTSSFTRYHANSLLLKAKSTGKYLSTVLALQEANASNADDAIFLDQQGYVSEGTGTNIFMVRNNVLYTPETTSALEGITRDTIFKFAAEMNIPVIEKQFTRDSLYIADEVFFCGTAAQIVGVVEVDNRQIANGKVGPITHSLMRTYQQCVFGELTNHLDWVTFINQKGEMRNDYSNSSNNYR